MNWRVGLVVGLTTLTLGCAHSRRFVPETPAPSDARVRELAARPASEGEDGPDRPALAVERVLPSLDMAPVHVRVWLRLQHDPANRDYCLQLVSADGAIVEGGCRAVEAKVWTRDFVRVLPGRYVVVLTVTRNDGRTLRAVSRELCYNGPQFSCADGAHAASRPTR